MDKRLAPKTVKQRRLKPDNVGFNNDSLNKTPNTQATESNTGIVAHTCNSVTQEAEAGGLI